MAKVSRKELLKRQDEFLTFTEKAGVWVRQYKRKLFTVVGVVALVVVIAAAVFTYNRYQQNQAALAYGQLFFSYQQTLTAPTPNAMATLIQAYNSFVDEYGSSKAGLQAQQCLASLYIKAGDMAKAEETLNQLVKGSGLEPAMLSQAWGTLGQCLEMTGKNQEAIEAYAKAATIGGPANAGMWKTAQARMLQASDPKAAQELYGQVLGTTSNRYLYFNARLMMIEMGQDPTTETSS